MGNRNPNPQLVKRKRNYTVEEVATTLGIHRNTVREWIKRGLPTIDQKRPTLVHGDVLRDFLRERRKKNKRPCGPGKIYCVRCRKPQKPAGDVADYETTTQTLGNLVGICPDCESMMYRRVNPAQLETIRGNLDIRMPKAMPQLDESD